MESSRASKELLSPDKATAEPGAMFSRSSSSNCSVEVLVVIKLPSLSEKQLKLISFDLKMLPLSKLSFPLPEEDEEEEEGEEKVEVLLESCR